MTNPLVERLRYAAGDFTAWNEKLGDEAADEIERLERQDEVHWKTRRSLLAEKAAMLDLTPVGPGRTVDDALTREKFSPWNVLDYIRTPEELDAYVEAEIERRAAEKTEACQHVWQACDTGPVAVCVKCGMAD